MWLEQSEHTEREGSRREKRTNGGESSSQPSSFDATTRFVFTETELRHAITEERREAPFYVKSAGVDLCQVLDELQSQLPLRIHDEVESPQKRVIREIGEPLHARLLS
jgi:hypothetical protein